MDVRIMNARSLEFQALARAWLPGAIAVSSQATIALVAFRQHRPVAFAVLDWIGGHLGVQHFGFAPPVGGLRSVFPSIRALWPTVQAVATRLGESRLVIPMRCDLRQTRWIGKMIAKLGGRCYALADGREWWALPTGEP